MLLRAIALAAVTAAEPPPAPAPVSAQTTHFAPQPALLAVGGTTFALGYAPVLGAGLPAVGGAAYRTFVTVATLGLGLLSECSKPGEHYICDATHGGVQLLLPIAGPFLFADDHPRDSLLNPEGHELSRPMRTALYISGGVQAAGATLLLASLAFGREVTTSDGSSRPAAARPKLLAIGGALLAGAYVGSLLASLPSLGGLAVRSEYETTPWGGALLAVPLAGPFVFAVKSPRDHLMNPTGQPLSAIAETTLVAASAAQVLGLGLLTAGLLAEVPKVRLVPTVSSSGVGVSAGWIW